MVAALPDEDAPALFGLPANVNRAAQQANSAATVAKLRQMSASAAAAAGFDRRRWAAALAPLLRLWDSLVAGAQAGLRAAVKDLGAALTRSQSLSLGRSGTFKARAPAAGASPVDEFVALQRQAAQQLVALLDRSLSGVLRALRGQAPWTPALQALAASLVADAVPEAWDAVWEGPAMPAEYCAAVMRRAAAIEQWAASAAAGSLLDGASPLDLSELLHPGAFLNALRQQTARALSTPLDALRLDSAWDSGRLRGATLAVPVAGLLIQGASFEGSRLTALDADAPVSRAVPTVTLAWVPADAAPVYPHALRAPLYLTADRARVLTEVSLPIATPEEAPQWVLAGVALLLAA